MRDPVRVSELRGVGALRTRLDVSRARGFSRFVGRIDEMATLEAALGRAIEGNAQVVGIVGEAGVGKSRLCFEFAERCRAQGLAPLEAHGVAHGKATPLVPILELYRGYYGITEQDDDRAAREKIAGRLLLLDESFREALPLQFEFLGVPDPDLPAPRMNPDARQRQLFAGMKRVIQLGSRQQTMVTLLEDLHWLDGASNAFVEQLVDAVQGTRSLLLVNFRPEYHAGWMQKSYYQQVPMLPLGAEATRELLHDLLGSDPSLAGLAERIHERTGGNPFFLEEVVQSLAESRQLEGSRGAYRLRTAAAELAVPGSVQAVLTARIDRLAEREKQVLQTAAVIGKTFTERILAGVTDLPDVDLRGSLEVLKGGEFIYESSIYPELEYTFKHPLTQEVAYGSQLKERRQRIHTAVARALLELDSEKLDERAALLAHHFEGAGETLEAARWHRRAAEWVGVSDIVEARRHWQRVWELARQMSDPLDAAELGVLACRQILINMWRLGVSEKQQREVYNDAKKWLERLGDLEAEAHFEYAYSISWTISGSLEQGITHGLEAERLAEQAGNPHLAVLLSPSTIVALREMGPLHEARQKVDRLLEETRDQFDAGTKIWGGSSYIWALGCAGDLESLTGDLQAARKMLHRAVELAQEHQDLENQIWWLSAYRRLNQIDGDIELGLSQCRRGVEIADRFGSLSARVEAMRALGILLVYGGRAEEAVALLQEALHVAREMDTSLAYVSEMLEHLAEALLAAGQLGAARDAAEESVAVAQRSGFRVYEAGAHLALARVVLRAKGAAEANAIRGELDRAEALFRETGAKNFQPFVHLERAQHALLQDEAETRERELRAALDQFREMKAPIRVGEVEGLLGRSQ